MREDGGDDKGRNKKSKRGRCLKKNGDDIDCDSEELHEYEEWFQQIS